MAQALARGIVNKKGLSKKIKVNSAGTSIIPNSKAADAAIIVMEERGLDLRKHTAKQLTPEMIKNADLVLTMTRNHKQYVLSMAPEAQEKVFTLKEYVRDVVTDSKDVEIQLLNLAHKLEAKEAKFYEENKKELDKLKEEKNRLKEMLQETEKKIQDWHIKYHEATKVEREALKKLEEKLLDIDVLDPIGQPPEKYKECADEMNEAIELVIEKIAKEMN